MTYGPFEGLQDCVYCSTGDPTVTSATSCNDGKCDPGTKKEFGSCVSCPSGRFNRLRGQTACTFCPKGFVGEVNRIACAWCPKGSYGDAAVRSLVSIFLPANAERSELTNTFFLIIFLLFFFFFSCFFRGLTACPRARNVHRVASAQRITWQRRICPIHPATRARAGRGATSLAQSPPQCVQAATLEDTVLRSERCPKVRARCVRSDASALVPVRLHRQAVLLVPLDTRSTRSAREAAFPAGLGTRPAKKAWSTASSVHLESLLPTPSLVLLSARSPPLGGLPPLRPVPLIPLCQMDFVPLTAPS